ncbi:MAG: polyprenol phosphomannose-dependent alpha 1,6 mannosyltransferase MptB [Anaerolineales bacterium]|jgi:hypothetical protein
MAACFAALVPLPSLRGSHVITFLAYFTLAATAYLIATLRMERDRIPIGLIWGLALLFRLTLLLTSPTLSDDVYRYIWDGHLLNQGLNPYALPVDSPELDAYTIPPREMVNNAWMASPYLPAAQGFFAAAVRLVPQSALVFQVGAALFDLAAGWLVMDILRRLRLPRRRVLLYLWNPLVVVEFAHGAHLDAWMIFLVMLAFWLLAREKADSPRKALYRTGSALALAAATLTKIVPVLLVPLFLRRWGWKKALLYAAALLFAAAPFALTAGWGLLGPLDGTGLFGATRIYRMYWNYNSSLYHWLEVALSGYPTPGAVPLEVVGEGPGMAVRLLVSALMALVSLATLHWTWRLDDPAEKNPRARNLNLLRLASFPLGAYLLLTPTVHPWYMTVLTPLLPFLLPQEGESPAIRRFAWAWLYFSIAVAFSYLTYLDPQNLREFAQVRWLEYLPLLGLLGWATVRNLPNS